MKRMNLIAVFDASGKRVLMCRRRKEPYKGLLNLVGGKAGPGEDSLDAAYRELYEETGLTREDVELTYYADCVYFTTGYELEWYVGQLQEEKAVYGEENELLWVDVNDNFFDMTRFAGEGNVGHMLEEVRLEGLIRGWKDDQ